MHYCYCMLLLHAFFPFLYFYNVSSYSAIQPQVCNKLSVFSVCFGHSRSSKVISFCTNLKRVCDFLLVRHSNLGPILHRFRDIAGFALMTPPLFHRNFGGVPVAPDRSCWGKPEHKNLKPISGKIMFEVLQRSCVKTCLNVRDGRTDDLLWHNGALRSIAR